MRPTSAMLAPVGAPRPSAVVAPASGRSTRPRLFVAPGRRVTDIVCFLREELGDNGRRVAEPRRSVVVADLTLVQLAAALSNPEVSTLLSCAVGILRIALPWLEK